MSAPFSSDNSISAVPRVSIILTVYKRTTYLPEALESALTQLYRDFEVIIADDSGVAASRHIVAARNDSRVKYVSNPATIGIARSLVNAVEQARGEFIAILNDDDVWEREFLAELTVPLLADSTCIAAFSDHSVMDGKGQVDPALTDTWSASTGRLSLPEGSVSNPDEFMILKGGIPIANAAVFRKDAVDWSQVGPEVSGAYDYWISCLLVASGRPIHYVPKRLARYRVHGEMETRRRSHDKNENLVFIFSTIRKRRWFPRLDSTIKSKLAEALLVVARDKLHFDRLREARRYFWRSFVLSFRPMAMAGVVGTYLPCSFRKRLWAWSTAATRLIFKISILRPKSSPRPVHSFH